MFLWNVSNVLVESFASLKKLVDSDQRNVRKNKHSLYNVVFATKCVVFAFKKTKLNENGTKLKINRNYELHNGYECCVIRNNKHIRKAIKLQKKEKPLNKVKEIADYSNFL